MHLGDIGKRRHKKVSDLRKIGLCNIFRVFFLHPFHQQHHIGLTRTKPDIADQNIVDHYVIAGTDIQRIRTARLHRRQPDQPAAVRSGPGLVTPTGELQLDPLAWCRPAPERNGHIALQHHFIGDQCW